MARITVKGVINAGGKVRSVFLVKQYSRVLNKLLHVYLIFHFKILIVVNICMGVLYVVLSLPHN